MTNYREILRLYSPGLNKAQIAQSIGCSRTTVIQVLNVSKEKGGSYPLPEDISDRKLSEMLFPSDRSKPDYEYVHKKLQKNGVTLNLLLCRKKGRNDASESQARRVHAGRLGGRYGDGH